MVRKFDDDAHQPLSLTARSSPMLQCAKRSSPRLSGMQG
jgi:hypothetical protein